MNNSTRIPVIASLLASALLIAAVWRLGALGVVAKTGSSARRAGASHLSPGGACLS